MQYKNNNVQLYQQFHEQHVLSLITILLHVLHILLKNLSYFYIHVNKFQCMLCVLTFDKSATLSMASWSLTIQTYSLPKITKQEGKHHYSWQCSVYVLYKVQNLYSCTFSELKKKMQVHSSVISNFCNLHTSKHQKL